jgi:hypothetical protein
MKYYILKGVKPIKCEDQLTWAMWFEKTDGIVKKTQIDTDEEVCTVFLGFDHQWGDGPPLLFETMVFGGKLDGDQYRYSTWDEAVEGHSQVVEMVMAK